MSLKINALCLIPLFLFILNTSLIEAFVLGKTGNYAVLRGTSLVLQCVPRADAGPSRRSLTPVVASTAVWTDVEGRELADARYAKQANGNLEITNAHVGDSGVFKCKVRDPVEEGISKVYEHKLVVYELAGHKFLTTLVVDLSKYSVGIIETILGDLITKICGQDLCAPGSVRAKDCESPDRLQELCEFSIVYEGINQIADEECDEDCVRQKIYGRLKKAESILMIEMLKMRDAPDARLKPDAKTIETKHLVTCRAGFHLVKSFFKRCFPCLPGYYSKQNSAKCNLCNVGYYQDKYGRHDCEKCEESKSTNTMGAKSKEECVPAEKTGILGNIKEGIASLFSG